MFGSDATGVREDEAKPFRTLQAALAAALPGDTVYAQPGAYVDPGPLVLRDEVNWYFTLGALVTQQGPLPVFADALGPVRTALAGFGSFVVGGGASLLQLTQGSTVSFQGLDFNGTGTGRNDDPGSQPAMFLVASARELDLSGRGFFAAQGLALVTVSGPARVLWRAQTLESQGGLLLSVASTANGTADLATQEALGGHPLLGALSVRSNDFALSVASEVFSPVTPESHAVQVLVPTISGVPPVPGCQVNLAFQTVDADGGLLRVEGQLGPMVPLAQPNVRFAAQAVSVASDTVSMVNLSAAVLHFSFQHCRYDIGDAAGAVTFVSNSAALFMEGQLRLENAYAPSGNPVLFRALGGSTLAVDIAYIVFVNAVLLATGQGQFTLTSDFIFIADVPAGQSAFSSDGSLTLDILSIAANLGARAFDPSPAAGATNSLVAVLAPAGLPGAGASGRLTFQDAQYGGENTFGVWIDDGCVLEMAADALSSDAFNTTLLFSRGARNLVRVTAVQPFGGGNGVHLGGLFGLSVLDIGSVQVGNFGVSQAYALEVVDLANAEGFVGMLASSLGPALHIGTSGQVNFVFTHLTNGAPFGSPVRSAPALLIDGTGLFTAQGNDLQCFMCEAAIERTGGFPGTATLQVERVFVGDATVAVRSSGFLGRLTVTINDATASGVSEAAFEVLGNASLVVQGGSYFANQFGLPVPVFLAQPQSDLFVAVESVASGWVVVDIRQAARVWYHAERTVVNNGDPAANVVTVSSPAAAAGDYTVGGYLATGGSDAIEFSPSSAGPGFLRLSSSTLVSSLYSIANDSPFPVNVVVQPTSARMPVFPGVGMTLSPAAAFFVDPNVS